MGDAFDYFQHTQYPMLASDYPYTSGNGEETKECLYSDSKAI